MISYAANNYLWISCSNSSAQESCWGSFAVRPDGVVAGRLVKNTDDILLSRIDTGKKFYDATKDWRKRAMQGILHSGETVRDPRSADRYSL